MTRGFHKFTSLLLIATLIVVSWPTSTRIASAAPIGQTGDLRVRAREILSKMTPQERVGQLFLVTFKGRDVSEKNVIYDLIVNKHIGGVVLLASNDNFIGPDNILPEIYQLTSSLQNLATIASQTPTRNPSNGQQSLPQYIPLFIGISQEGDSFPNDQILSGLSPLPNLMAIGATWNQNISQRVGQIMGKELSALGFNLYLGPSLDVLEDITNETREDMGARTFGGDPYWVGEMGRAYIEGLHEGSQLKMAVIAKHFPGRGSSDRPPEEEVATVRKSLEQLKQIELAPFFTVTGNSQSPAGTVDGLLVSHIRYQGFQGNIRSTTRPVSLDASAFEQLMNLEEFASWRNNGGVIISDDLGSKAVRKFYDPTGQAFDARQVARNALLAGNDVLYVNNFIATGDPDTYTTLVRTLDLFTQKYQEDPSFAERVDVSVERILMLKLRLYTQLIPEQILPDIQGLDDIGSSSLSLEIAQSSAALLSPSKQELEEIITRPPSLTERVVIFTDSVETRQCGQCAFQYSFPVDGLQKAIMRLYGPQTGGQAFQTKYASYSFFDLYLWLNGNVTETTTALETDLTLADWLIFNPLNVRAANPESNALRRFLDEKMVFYRNKKIVVFAFNVPYQLDATDISKLNAYYGLYSKNPAFLDTAARILFQEFSPNGNSPVSIPGIGYDLISIMSPNPEQVIPLILDSPESKLKITPIAPELTAEPTVIAKFMVGDSLPLKTGVIFDHNGNPVPDGTVVRFTITINGGEIFQFQESTTIQGVARTVYRIQNPGLLEFAVSSDPAFRSSILKLDASVNEAASITEIVPPTATVTPSDTPEPTPTLAPTLTSTPTPTPIETRQTNLVDWMIAMLVTGCVGAGAYWFGNRFSSKRWGVRWALLTGIGGSLAYTFIAAQLPGSPLGSGQQTIGRVLLLTVIGCLVGWISGWIWQEIILRRARRIRTSETK